MPSPETRAFRWLLAMEWRELAASRAWWVLLLLMGPLVGFSFIGAIRVYGELSQAGGTAEGVGEAFSPLIGVWAPTFSASELAAAFLLPFVAIRVVAGDRQSGALKLELQHPMPVWRRVAAKAAVLMAGWLVASIAMVPALVFWRNAGGTLHVPELVSVALGHLLNAGLTVGLAFAAAALADHPATAAIVTLSVTVGTWILNFIAAVEGGAWERLAAFTPTAMVAEFQHGLVRADLLLAAALLAGFGLGLAVVWTRLGIPVRRKLAESAAVALLVAAGLAGAAALRPAWDLSDGRINSFRRADERLLRTIQQPLRIEVHFAPEDPRRIDFEQHVLSKLRRVMRRLEVVYVSRTSTGLFEQADEHYGEIWYETPSGKAMARGITAESALERIYELAGVGTPVEEAADAFRGRPLAITAGLAPAIYYGAWPIAVLAAAIWRQRRRA